MARFNTLSAAGNGLSTVRSVHAAILSLKIHDSLSRIS